MPKISDTQKEERKLIILKSAAEVFGTKGYSESSMDDIVRHSGISKGGIYTYFPTKESIILEIAEQRFKLRNKLVNSLDGSLSASAQIEAYIRWLLESLDQESVISGSRFSFEFWTVISRNKEKSHLAKERFDKFEADLSRVIEAGIASGEFRKDLKVKSAALLLLSSMDGLGFMSTVMGIPVKEEAISELVAMILNHWRTEA